MTIAELQKIEDGADPIYSPKLLPNMQNFEMDTEGICEIKIDQKNLYLSVTSDLEEVEAKIDQDGNLIVKVKE